MKKSRMGRSMNVMIKQRVVLPKINWFINLKAFSVVSVDSCWGHKYVVQSAWVLLRGLKVYWKNSWLLCKICVWVDKYCTNHETKLIVNMTISTIIISDDVLYVAACMLPFRRSCFAVACYGTCGRLMCYISVSLGIDKQFLNSNTFRSLIGASPCFLQRLFVQAFADWRFWCRQVMSSPQVCCKFWASVLFIIVFIFPFLFCN